MKFAFKNLIVAAAFIAAGGAANAAVDSLTLAVGGSVTDQGWTVSGLTGSGTLTFSTSLIGALNTGKVTVAQASPATLATTPKSAGSTLYGSISAAAPVTSLTGTFDGSTVSIQKVNTAGGATMTAPVTFASSGGSLTISNLAVDLTTMKVYASLAASGVNGTKNVDNFELWDITNPIVGATSFAAVEGTTTSVNTLSGLKINTTAFDFLSSALGLKTAGIAALKTVTDFGSISSSISVTASKNVVTPTVPEPSTYAMMVAGLVGVSLVARRRAK